MGSFCLLLTKLSLPACNGCQNRNKCTLEKTIYSYVDKGLLDARNIDMPRAVRLRPRKGKKKDAKVDKKCRIGRTYEDFKNYRSQNPEQPLTEIDSVEGVKGGAVPLTIHFVRPKLQLSFKREHNDSRSVTVIFNSLYELLGADTYKKLFPLILGDNGSEFSNPTAIEKDADGNIRSRLFYCDAASPGQKGHCENKSHLCFVYAKIRLKLSFLMKSYTLFA